MVKPLATTTLSPLTLNVNAEVLLEQARAVLGQLHWGLAKRPRVHVSLNVADDGWATDAVGTLRQRFPVSGSYVEALRWQIRVRPEVKTINFGIRSEFAVGEGGDCRITIGAAAAVVLSPTDADNGAELTGSVTTLAAGTGKLLCTLELKTAGPSATNYVRNLRVEDVEIAAADLPDPTTD